METARTLHSLKIDAPATLLFTVKVGAVSPLIIDGARPTPLAARVLGLGHGTKRLFLGLVALRHVRCQRLREAAVDEPGHAFIGSVSVAEDVQRTVPDDFPIDDNNL